MLKKLWSYTLVLVGSALTAASFGLLILPQGFAAGGVTGFGVVLSEIFPLPVSTMVLILNALLFILGLIFVGKDFVMKTAIASISFPLMLEFFQKITVFSDLAGDPLLSSLLAGGILGLGSGLILLGNGSSGGFDILGVILFEKFRISVSLVMYITNTAAILIQAADSPLLNTVYGILVILVTSVVVNMVLTHGKSEGQMMIFSQAYDQIREELLGQHDVGMTFLNGETGYLRQPIKVIITVMPHDKIESIKKAVYRIDPTAFVLMDTVRFVGGRGYTINR